MSYSPKRYRLDSLGALDASLPPDEWIKREFLAFVRGEFAKRPTLELPSSWPPQIESEASVDLGFLSDLLAQSERTVYSPKFREWGEANDPKSMASAILNFLCDPAIGSRKNKENNSAETFVASLTPLIESQDRLLFVLPGFPFKDQNRFRTAVPPGVPDLADISFMIRLHVLTQAIYQVHPYGADVLVLADGGMYAPIFGVDPKASVAYLERLKSYRNLLNLQGTVSFINLTDLVDSTPAFDAETSVADEVTNQLENRLRVLSETDIEIEQAFQILTQGMKWNYNTRTSFAETNDADCWKLLRYPIEDIDERLAGQWEELNALAVTAALTYAARNLMLRRLDLIRAFFPDAIRATVHPKRDQFSLAGSGGAYPWNGSAWSEGEPTSIQDVSTKALFDLSNQGPLELVTFGPDAVPLYLRRSGMNG